MSTELQTSSRTLGVWEDVPEGGMRIFEVPDCCKLVMNDIFLSPDFFDDLPGLGTLEIIQGGPGHQLFQQFKVAVLDGLAHGGGADGLTL